MVREQWCRKRDSNPRPPLYESGALPAELLRRFAAPLIVARGQIRKNRSTGPNPGVRGVRLRPAGPLPDRLSLTGKADEFVARRPGAFRPRPPRPAPARGPGRQELAR